MKKKKILLWAGIIGASCLFGAAIALLGVTGDARTIALVLCGASPVPPAPSP